MPSRGIHSSKIHKWCICALLCVLSASQLSGCNGEDGGGESSGGGGVSESSCEVVTTGSVWVPSVTGASDSNHDSAVTVSTTTLTGSGSVIGLGQPVTADKEISITVDMSSDLGVNGSLSLVAEVTDFPSNLAGSAYPVLVSLSDGTNEWVNLALSGGDDCRGKGIFTCSGGSCTTNSDCTVGATSAFSDRRHWQQNQVPAYGYTSTNTFPTCNWSSGTPACDFNGTFFDSGKLRSGVNYTAKYVLMASNYSTLSSATAGIRVTVVKKTDTTARDASGNNGAVDLNVILTGTTNIQASRTSKGQQNLDALFQHVYNHFSQTGVGVRLGKINVFEWSCDDGGDTYANVDLDDLGAMFSAGSGMLPSSVEGDALNIFLVSTIPYSSSNLTILGVASSIGGPMINGTQSSGLAFSSFNKIDTFNPSCGGSCPESDQESDFISMASTITHEIGHYLGLNHPSERTASSHDVVPDTPECTAETIGGQLFVTHDSCRATGTDCRTNCAGYDGSSTFCSTETSCQFNHVMWWTTKNINAGAGTRDGELFSTHSSVILNYNPFIR